MEKVERNLQKLGLKVINFSVTKNIFILFWFQFCFLTLDKDKPRLDHRQYGVWYLEPKKWEPRFHQKSDQKLVKKIKSRRSGKEDSSKPSTELESADIKPEKDEEKLHAVRAFKSFLDRKTGYEAPPFLKKALEVPEDK